MPLWMADSATGNFNTIGAANDSVTFYLWVTQGSTQSYNIVSTINDPNVLSISIDSQTGVARSLNAGFQTAKITVAFTCSPSKGFGFVSLSVSVDPFDPFTIAWFKECLAPTLPPTAAPTASPMPTVAPSAFCNVERIFMDSSCHPLS